MKQMVKCIFISLGISMVIISCNSDGKKTENTTTDTTAITCTPPEQGNELDAVKAAPGLYKILHDTAGIRILEINYKPGDSSAMHTHPENVVYVIEGGTN